jgi:hypothetical protein
MKIDLRFTLDSENEDHKRALNVYNTLRRKHRVDFFVEMTKPYWDKDLVNYPNISRSEAKENMTTSPQKSEPLNSSSLSNESTPLKSSEVVSKKRNPLLG